jgi:cytochrome P450
VVVADPQAVLPLQEANPESARAGAARRQVLPFAPAPSVFAGDGEGHAEPQRRIAPALGAEAMAARRLAMVEIATRLAARWPRGRPFRLLPQLRAVTDEISVRLVLGVREEEIVTALTSAIQRMLRTPGNPPSTLPGEGDGLVGALGQRIFRWRAGPLEHNLARAIEARRLEPGGEQPDVLGCMIGAEPPLRTPAIVAELLSSDFPPDRAASASPTGKDRFLGRPYRKGRAGEQGALAIWSSTRRSSALPAPSLRLTEPRSG